MEPMRQNQRRHYVSSCSPGGGTGDEVAVYDCLVSIESVAVLAAVNTATRRRDLGAYLVGYLHCRPAYVHIARMLHS